MILRYKMALTSKKNQSLVKFHELRPLSLRAAVGTDFFPLSSKTSSSEMAARTVSGGGGLFSARKFCFLLVAATPSALLGTNAKRGGTADTQRRVDEVGSSRAWNRRE